MSGLGSRLSPSTPQFPASIDYATIISAVSGLVVGLLQVYVYPDIPVPLQALIPTVVVGLIGYLGARLVKKNAPIAAAAAAAQAAMSAQLSPAQAVTVNDTVNVTEPPQTQTTSTSASGTVRIIPPETTEPQQPGSAGGT